MAYDFSTFDARGREISEWLTKEFASVRTGRATPALLDGVQVESYGARVPLNQVGTVGVEDPRTIRISIWDKGLMKAVEKAIVEANLGLSVVGDDKGLRVVFPELTGERRSELMKVAKVKLEAARVSLRGLRDETIKKMESETTSDDERARTKEELQKRMDKLNAALEQQFIVKEGEVMQ